MISWRTNMVGATVLLGDIRDTDRETRFRCPACAKADVFLHIKPIHRTRIGGMTIVVQNARLWKCNHCGEEIVAAAELKRWEAIKNSLAVPIVDKK